MISNAAYLRMVESTRRLLRAPTERPSPKPAPDWQRESEPRWHEDPQVWSVPLEQRDTWHPDEARARAQIAAGNDVALEQYDALREAIREREAIEAEVAALAGDHDDIDALTLNLPALRVPDEHCVFVRLVWLVRRWWTRRIKSVDGWGRSPERRWYDG